MPPDGDEMRGLALSSDGQTLAMVLGSQNQNRLIKIGIDGKDYRALYALPPEIRRFLSP
jgi:hypothetical protein